MIVSNSIAEKENVVRKQLSVVLIATIVFLASGGQVFAQGSGKNRD